MGLSAQISCRYENFWHGVKSSSCQRRVSDWEARPLSPAQAAYAALDAHALVRIHDAIAAQLGRDALLALCRGRSGSGALGNGSGGAGRGGGSATGLATHGGRLLVSAGLSGVDGDWLA